MSPEDNTNDLDLHRQINTLETTIKDQRAANEAQTAELKRQRDFFAVAAEHFISPWLAYEALADRVPADITRATIDEFVESLRGSAEDFYLRPAARKSPKSAAPEEPPTDGQLKRFFGPTSVGKEAADLMKRSPERYRRMQQIARERGIIG